MNNTFEPFFKTKVSISNGLSRVFHTKGLKEINTNEKGARLLILTNYKSMIFKIIPFFRRIILLFNLLIRGKQRGKRKVRK